MNEEKEISELSDILKLANKFDRKLCKYIQLLQENGIQQLGWLYSLALQSNFAHLLVQVKRLYQAFDLFPKEIKLELRKRK